MKLFYTPGACSLGIHVLLEELGLPHEGVLVNLREGQQFSDEYRAINPKAKVPAVVLDDGAVLTEWIAIAHYLAATNPQAQLVPSAPVEAARCNELVAYINGWMHPQGFTRIFRPDRFAPNPEDKEAVREQGRKIFAEGFDLIDNVLADGREWLLGSFSIADAALFYVSFWAEGRQTLKLPPHVAAHYARMKARPAVARAMEQERLS
ncbi:MAG: glutathione S-transferase [Acidiphilium sp. 37-67-22]|nr:MAG: glutathione S-transferase [Acidiphilium sp. 37-67-22]HQT72348.1 glutathione S-transferase N-terminal domain-containing protein [Acidiphilium sp.]